METRTPIQIPSVVSVMRRYRKQLSMSSPNVTGSQWRGGRSSETPYSNHRSTSSFQTSCNTSKAWGSSSNMRNRQTTSRPRETPPETRRLKHLGTQIEDPNLNDLRSAKSQRSPQLTGAIDNVQWYKLLSLAFNVIQRMLSRNKERKKENWQVCHLQRKIYFGRVFYCRKYARTKVGCASLIVLVDLTNPFTVVYIYRNTSLIARPQL